MFCRALPVLLAILVMLGLFVSSRAAPLSHASPFPRTVTVQRPANLRAGPGTHFAISGTAKAGRVLQVIGCNADCSWYQVSPDCWIAAFLVAPMDGSMAKPVATPVATGSPHLPTVVFRPTLVVPGLPVQTTRCPQTAVVANTYAGPGAFHPVVDTRPAGECVAIVGRNFPGDWFQLSHGMWIAASAILYAEPLETMPVTDRFFTATPAPFPTPFPPLMLSAEEQEYLRFLQTQGAVYEMAWREMDALFLAAGQDLTLINTAEWKSQVNSTFALIQSVNGELRGRILPPRFVSIHTEFVNAANHFDMAARLVAEGVDNYDANKLVAAQLSMREGNLAIRRGLNILEGLKIEGETNR